MIDAFLRSIKFYQKKRGGTGCQSRCPGNAHQCGTATVLQGPVSLENSTEAWLTVLWILGGASLGSDSTEHPRGGQEDCDQGPPPCRQEAASKGKQHPQRTVRKFTVQTGSPEPSEGQQCPAL